MNLRIILDGTAIGGLFLRLFAHGNKRQQRNVRGLRNLPYRRLIADDLDVHGVAVHHGVQDAVSYTHLTLPTKA